MSKRKNHRNGHCEKDVIQVKPIQPLTDTQHKVFKDFYNDKNLLLHGYAGSGKTFLAMYLGLKEVHEINSEYNKLLILRSAVPARDIGFMPGSLDEKLEIYQCPYKSICHELTGKIESYDKFKKDGLIEFISTSYIRGTTVSNSVLVVDEIQNCDWGELSTIMTRLGDNCRVIFCGDFRQSDFRGHETSSKKDVHTFMNILKKMTQHFSCIEFGVNDIVRSPMVRDFIIEAGKLSDTY